jgi:hypothetical protein
MSNITNESDSAVVRAEDVLPVGSRVSWGAIFAGAVVSMAIYLVLTLLGSAIGLTVNRNFSTETLGVAAIIWAVLSTVFALFVGGWVTSQLTVGENQFEGALHGLIMWGAVCAIMLWLVAVGVQSGFNAMIGLAYVGAADRNLNWEASARQAGVTQAQIDEWKRARDGAAADARRPQDDPEARRRAAEEAGTITWWALVGTLLSMASAVVGAIAGSGPTLRLVAIERRFRRPAAPAPSRVLAGKA